MNKNLIVESDDITLWRVENTPFNILRDTTGRYAIVINNTRHDKNFETIEQAEDYIEDRNWDLITFAAFAVATMITNNNK